MNCCSEVLQRSATVECVRPGGLPAAAPAWGVAGEPALVGAARETVVRALFGEGAEFLAAGAEPPPGAGRVLVAAGGEYSYDALAAEEGEAAAGAAQARRLQGKAVVIPHSDKLDPTKGGGGDKPAGYRIWLPDADDMTTDPYGSLHLLANIMKLVDNTYMRWFLQNGKCDFHPPQGLLPWKGPYEPGSVECSAPDLKLSYCWNFRFNVPIVGWLVQPVVPLCLPLDVLDILFGLGPALGAIVEDVLDQISPYIVQMTYDFVNCGGSQANLNAFVGVLTGGGLAAPPAATGESDGSSSGASPLGAVGAILQSDAWLNLALPPFDAQCFLTGEGVSGLLNTVLATEVVPSGLVPIVSGLDSIVDEYYNKGCTTEQILVWAPAALEALSDTTSTNPIGALYSASGTTADGQTVTLAQGPGAPGTPTILNCLGANLTLFLGVLGK